MLLIAKGFTLDGILANDTGYAESKAAIEAVSH